jgi:predicted Fe-S protein YdhL (DUF1289 family)
MQNDRSDLDPDFDPDRNTGDVPSPCINVCRMSPETALCEGCLRSIDEIAIWGNATNDAKRAIWKLIKQRRSASK